jgi:hypothetical protein
MIGFYDHNIPEDLLKNRMFPKKRRMLNYGINGATVQSSASNYINSFTQFESKLYLFLISNSVK